MLTTGNECQECVPFNRPFVAGKEFEYIQQAIDRMHISGDGYFSARCSKLLEELLGAPRVLLTTSCTHALEMASLLLDIGHGDEVIIPSFTFVSTANAFVLRGARPVFVDIRSDTLNMDETHLDTLISRRTKAIVPVHYAGIGCEMDAIMSIARDNNLSVVEDNAHGLFGLYGGRNLGTFGQLAAQSFHETKNLTCGEGGALIINDSSLIERAEIIREKGTNRSKFFRGQVDKYTWQDIGSSYLLSDILAAFLYAQLEERDNIQRKRRYIWEYYHESLLEWAQSQQVQLPHVPRYCKPSYHMFHLIMPSEEQRDSMIKHLRNRGVNSVFHYLPLHLSKVGKRFGGKPGLCPVAENISDKLLRLPFHNRLTQENLEQIVAAVHSYESKQVLE